MWGIITKVGGSILAGLGLDWAWDSYKESQAQAQENAQMEKQANWGKYILIALIVGVSYKLLKKGK